jgi:hypothetical protein
MSTSSYAGAGPYAAKATDGTAITPNQYGQYSGADINNDGGKIKANGTVTSGVVSSVSTPTPVVATFASTVIEDTVTTIDYAGKAVSGGVFAHNHVKPISVLITDEIAGLSSDAIKSPGNDDVIRSINKLETLRTRRFTTAIREGRYNRVTNTFEAGYPVVAVDALASDSAANPTSSVPGTLRFLSGSKVPTAQNYEPKTVY